LAWGPSPELPRVQPWRGDVGKRPANNRRSLHFAGRFQQSPDASTRKCEVTPDDEPTTADALRKERAALEYWEGRLWLATFAVVVVVIGVVVVAVQYPVPVAYRVAGIGFLMAALVITLRAGRRAYTKRRRLQEYLASFDSVN
jgi:Flp pilus assembly protein TadB